MHFYSVSTLFTLAIAVSATPIPEERNYLAARDVLGELQPRKFKVCSSVFEDCGLIRGKLPCCGTLLCKSGTCVEVRVFPSPFDKA
ncbi:hypothetical protein CGRA01v4_04653 [Colletotrichum graminicola]|nr:hypothetical protein CGRA01v4_04653 [Colletotrichum graminicola]